jgi:hypothetical protein
MCPLDLHEEALRAARILTALMKRPYGCSWGMQLLLPTLLFWLQLSSISSIGIKRSLSSLKTYGRCGRDPFNLMRAVCLANGSLVIRKNKHRRYAIS